MNVGALISKLEPMGVKDFYLKFCALVDELSK